jgi:LuxR family transcriptional regulator of spore coat protein
MTNGTWNALAPPIGNPHMAAKGKTYWETARILGIGYASVHTHMDSLKLKLNAANATHAVARGYELGILELHTAEPRVMMAVS